MTYDSIPEIQRLGDLHDLSTDFQITLERGPCFGACPAYRVTIDAGGNVVYEGMSFVAVEGTQTATISEDQLMALATAFRDADFFSLEDSYVSQATDLPSASLSLTMNGETKTIYHYPPECDSEFVSAPQVLCDLETLVDGTANVEQWVEGQ